MSAGIIDPVVLIAINMFVDADGWNKLPLTIKDPVGAPEVKEAVTPVVDITDEVIFVKNLPSPTNCCASIVPLELIPPEADISPPITKVPLAVIPPDAVK